MLTLGVKNPTTIGTQIPAIELSPLARAVIAPAKIGLKSIEFINVLETRNARDATDIMKKIPMTIGLQPPYAEANINVPSIAAPEMNFVDVTDQCSQTKLAGRGAKKPYPVL